MVGFLFRFLRPGPAEFCRLLNLLLSQPCVESRNKNPCLFGGGVDKVYIHGDSCQDRFVLEDRIGLDTVGLWHTFGNLFRVSSHLYTICRSLQLSSIGTSMLLVLELLKMFGFNEIKVLVL
ncbi:hypothetical protein HS088_TW04G00360 [Tripterygium wilfordii]|uniref:Uncharacterized protein n=1 Tax=Tripterygium wilfordii TaxID=458696 RepID=A0A7J7DQ14_TRIWF|nr:hypothetical protein HS088_TW04G00360 [Tripterygium wilfordii]